MKKIIILDYGLGNVMSVKNACKFFEKNSNISDDINLIDHATHLIVPGVGSYKEGMNNLKNKQLDEVVKNFYNSKRPILGICLGLQLFFSSSEEHGITDGLDLIKGKVVSIKSKVKKSQKIPIIGWKDLIFKKNIEKKYNLEHLKNVFYFDHSFMVEPQNKDIVKASYYLNNIDIPSIVENDNFFGCQFHPEKSGEIGLNLLENFLKS